MTITLATLPQATEQEIFDQVVAHLAKQRVGSFMEGKGCAYRGEGGTMCAAGCLIADDEYSPQMDDLSTPTAWSELAFKGFVPSDHLDFILELQRIHDGNFEEKMDSGQLWDALNKFFPLAINKNLNTKVLDEAINAL